MGYVRGGKPFGDNVFDKRDIAGISYTVNTPFVDGNIVIKDSVYEKYVSLENIEDVDGGIDGSRMTCNGPVKATDMAVAFSTVLRYAEVSGFLADGLHIGGAFNAEGATMGDMTANDFSCQYSFYAPESSYDTLELEAEIGLDLELSGGTARNVSITGNVDRYAYLNDVTVEKDLRLDGLTVSAEEPQKRRDRRGIVAESLEVGGMARIDLNEVYGDVTLVDGAFGELHLFGEGQVDISGTTIGRLVYEPGTRFTVDENTGVETAYRRDLSLEHVFNGTF